MRSALLKTDPKKILSKLNNKHKIWSLNYQNTTGSEKAPRTIKHHGYYVIQDKLSFKNIVKYFRPGNKILSKL